MKRTISIILIIVTIFLTVGIQNNVYATHTAGEVIKEADGFISTGEQHGTTLITESSLKNLSDTIYNILLVVGIVAAVIIGVLLGIKFIMSGADGKAEVQKSLVIYVIGCVVVFGAFTIWKIVVSILQSM